VHLDTTMMKNERYTDSGWCMNTLQTVEET